MLGQTNMISRWKFPVVIWSSFMIGLKHKCNEKAIAHSRREERVTVTLIFEVFWGHMRSNVVTSRAEASCCLSPNK